MDFLTPYFLIGLAGAALPILIHLLTRDRIRRVAFSTLRFFAGTSKSVLRRKRFQEALLLAMRALACALLAIAFARPLWRSGEAGWGGLLQPGTARILVVDLSASMGREGMAARMQEEALTALNSLKEGQDLAALVTFTDRPKLEVPLTGKLGKVRARLAELAPGRGGTDIAAAIQQADTLLREGESKAKEAVLVSDLQRTGWERFQGGWKLAPGVKLVIRKVEPPEETANLAIVEADYPQSAVASTTPRTVAIRVANFSAAERRDVQVSLEMAGEQVASQKVNLRPGARAPVRFRRAFTSPGDNPGVIRVVAADVAPEDNVFYFNVRVIPRIKVVVLNGRPSSNPLTDAAYFLETALAPSDDTPFLVKSIDAAKTPPEEIDDALVAILADVGTVADPVRGALARLLERGGGVLFLPGDRVDPEVFNRVFGKLAPCGLRQRLTPAARAGEEAETRITKVDYEHPVFEIFHRPHHGDLSRPQFVRFWEVTDSQLSRVLARFGDGRPALLERQIGAGIAMVLVSPADVRWNSLPLRAIFLPFLHQTVRYLAMRTEARAAFRVGDRLPVPEGCSLRDPGGGIHEGRDAVAAEPGFHLVLDGGGREVFQFAVNRDPAEADPATVEPEEVAAAIERAPEEVIENEQDADAPHGPRRDDERGLWWYVVLTVVALSIGELYLGNKTMRH